MANFPTSLDSLTNPSATDEMDDAGVLHDVQHSDLNDIAEALEAKVGIDSSGVATSLDYLIKSTSGGHHHDNSGSRRVAAQNLDQFAWVKKGSDESSASSTVQADDDLLFAIGTAGTWLFRVGFIISTTDSTAGFKMSVTGPASATASYLSGDSPAAAVARTASSIGGEVVIASIASSGDSGFVVSGWVTAGGTAGNVNINWCRDSGSATVTVEAGSFLHAQRVA